MLKGIIYVISACLIWGLIFVIPTFLEGFSAVEIAVARCFSFGFFTTGFIFLRKRHLLTGTQKEIWYAAFLFTFLSSVIHYFTLVLGLRYASASVTTLIIGTAPVCISIFGNIKQPDFSMRPLLLPCGLLAVGLILVNLQPLLSNLHNNQSHDYFWGLFFGLISLVSWVWVAIANAKFLKKHDSLPVGDWVTLMGLANLCWSTLSLIVLMLIFASEGHISKYQQFTHELATFVIAALILGLGCSWLASYFWNQGTKRLPIGLLGQLTIFETVFALIFLSLIEQRVPHSLELIGISIALIGIASNVFLLNKSRCAQVAK